MRADAIPDVPVSHATLDVDGRLIAADPAILSLNAHAGGTLGATLAVPQLATVVRLARRLGVLVSRAVTVGDDDADIDLWVRVQPDGDGTRLSISGWRELRPRSVAAPPATVIEAGDVSWETDAALRLTFVSIETSRRYGVDALALLGRPLTSLFALDEAGEGGLPILEAVARRTPLHDQPARLRANDMPVALTARIKRDAAGEFAGLDGVARVTDTSPPPRRPAVMAPGFTEGLDRALRAPLARIIAHADTIHAEAEGPVQRDYVDYASDIANAGRHLLGLVDDLVDLQAVEGPDFAIEAERIDLADVARRAAGLLSVRAANAGVAIARPLPDLAMPATGDFRRVLQIMVNLIGNAVRYSPEGGVVTVTAMREGDHVAAVVADQGKGIAPADQARIFDKFVRIDPSEVGGNGLGLYIARRLAEAMGGGLTVDSVPGEGARFMLTLPA